MFAMDLAQIKEIIPHRYPFLLVDRVLDIEPGVSAVGIKNLTANEPFFQGHFPDYPVMPGVLIIEALAQLGAITVLSMDEHKNKLGFLTGADKFKFRQQVVPGDVLRLEIELVKVRSNMGKGIGKAYVGDKLAASGELMFALGVR